MVIVGFSEKTHLIFVRAICGRFKHCAIITNHANKLVLHQFVQHHNIAKIAITERGLTQLKCTGWVFVRLPRCNIKQANLNAWTCVNYVKSGLGIKNIWIQTPNQLYKYLKKNLTSKCQIFS